MDVSKIVWPDLHFPPVNLYVVTDVGWFYKQSFESHTTSTKRAASASCNVLDVLKSIYEERRK